MADPSWLRIPPSDLPRPPPYLYLAQLPKELRYELLDRLEYEDILEVCQVPTLKYICQDDAYWSHRLGSPTTMEEYLDRKYGESLQRHKRAASIYPYRHGLNGKKLDVAWEDVFFSLILDEGDNPEELRYYTSWMPQNEKQRYEMFKRNLYVIAARGRWKILCWLAKQGVWFGRHKHANGMAKHILTAGTVRDLQCLEQIVEINWNDVVGGPISPPLDLARYIVESKKLSKPALVGMYVAALRKGNEEVLRYLDEKGLVSADTKRKYPQ